MVIITEKKSASLCEDFMFPAWEQAEYVENSGTAMKNYNKFLIVICRHFIDTGITQRLINTQKEINVIFFSFSHYFRYSKNFVLMLSQTPAKQAAIIKC